jgi:hypothetical protein
LWCADAWVSPVGVASVASSAFDLNPGCSWLDDPSNVAFASPVSAAEAKPDAVSLVAGGKTSGGGGSGEPIKALGKLQDRFPRAGIGQLPSHLSRLLGAVELLPGFIQNRRHFNPPSIAFLLFLGM